MNVCKAPVLLLLVTASFLPHSSSSRLLNYGSELWLISRIIPKILEYMFGKRMTPAERLRKNQRSLDKAIRELDQLRVKLEKQEKTLIQQIKTSAQKGQMGACKIQAKDLVRTRRLDMPLPTILDGTVGSC